jgi:hypothetical protein
MTCQRCAGLMVTEHLEDMEGSVATTHAGWRCLQCGNIYEAGITANRHRVTTEPYRSRARPRYPHSTRGR